MNIAVLFGKLKNLKRAFFCDVVRAVCFNGVIRHITELNAPVVAVIRAAFVKHGSRCPA